MNEIVYVHREEHDQQKVPHSSMRIPTHTLQVETVKWDELTPHPDNPRNGDISVIAESLAVNGQYRPLVIAADGTILAGNHTYMAAAEIGMETLAVVRLNLHPYSPEARRILLTDNRTSDRGQYDDGLLLKALEALDAEAGGLIGTGYNQEDLADLETLLRYQSEIPLNVEEDRRDMGTSNEDLMRKLQSIHEEIGTLRAEIEHLVKAWRRDQDLTRQAREALHGDASQT